MKCFRMQVVLIIILLMNSVFAEIRHTGWPLQKLSWDIDKAYPGVEYNYRLAIRGGEYPYSFYLIKCPSGMTINSCSGEIKWTPADTSKSNQIITRITDLKGDILKDTFMIDVTRDKFYFVDSAIGSNLNDGSEARPWLTMGYASATADSESFVYVKHGTYNETFSIAHNNCGRFLAYPGDSVKVVCVGKGAGSIGINGGNNCLFQGFTFDANDNRWLFSVGGYSRNIIWRKNKMHNCYSNDWENPAFIFFWDGDADPINLQNGYKNMVVQDNVFYDLRNVNDHGASVTMYDVQDMLYEDNMVSDIDGSGITDKDEGYMNTIRNNVINKCIYGIGLGSQYGESGDEINYNHIYSCTTGVKIGSQPGYLKNVFCHHNNIFANISFSYILTDTNSTNINVYKNIIGNGTKYPYNVQPIKKYDTSIVNGALKVTYHYDYPDYLKTMDSEKVLIDSNVVWSTINADYIAGYDWGLSATNLADWRSRGFDKNDNSIFMQLKLGSDYMPINFPDSLKIYGNYGSKIKFIENIPDNHQDTNSVLNTLSILPNPFSPGKSASEFKSLSQKLGSNAPNGTCISFSIQVPNITIQTVKIEIFSLSFESIAKVVMSDVKKDTEYHLWWDGRTAKLSGVNWEELKPVESDANGREMAGNKMCRNGRYFVVFSVKDSNGNEKKFKKMVVLIK